MTETAIIALLGALGVIGAAAVTAVGVVLGLLWKRIAKLEASERETWWWARVIADLYYRYRREGAPDLPPPPKHEMENT